jgi:hypothetical protein
MTPITSSSSITAAQSLRLGEDAFSRRVEPKPLPSSRAPDRVEFSDAARQAAGSVRLDLVTRIRDEIQAGTYDTPERIDVAASDMTRALRGG